MECWEYHQATGELLDPHGVHVATGYSGQPPHVNVPEAEGLRALGPIPRGVWEMFRFDVGTLSLGACVIRLRPLQYAHGRTGFAIHGDSLSRPGYASHGCIILPRHVRYLLWRSSCHTLRVV